MNLSNVSNIRFNGTDVKLAKIDGVIIYRKEEENPLLKARYTANASGVVPTFNSGYVYEVNEVENNGIYTVEITSEDDFSGCSFNGRSNLLTVEYLKVTNKVTNMMQMFYNCKSLTSINTSGWNTSEVTRFEQLFRGCSALTSIDTSDWNTSNVTNSTYMFSGCAALTALDVSDWNTSKIYTMSYMFNGCKTLTALDLSGWDVGYVNTTIGMFVNCPALITLDSMMNIKCDLALPTNLNQESVLDVISNLATVDATKTLTISATQLSWIPEDKIKEANNKGWTISA